ncbi:hypothetical protein [Sinomonas atrocyanea]|uniref:hypothetical protein n=1 Tax=Sinomonas atrocyanea TaxID=37927 RepID=UPI00278B9A7B|nr:hypothetical protein [Sinomonas atrocyanea]MDQ0258977.1 hypothetical protein [Sinomonas atrocyanea]MDR6621916.1 hypothetical protein [Sinomonas atrocyanea]
MGIGQGFEDGAGATGSAGESGPWGAALELEAIREAEEERAAAGSPVEPEPWLLSAWERRDDPSTRPVLPPCPDSELLALIADDLAVEHHRARKRRGRPPAHCPKAPILAAVSRPLRQSWPASRPRPPSS